jgi:hypothetical protein
LSRHSSRGAHYGTAAGTADARNRERDFQCGARRDHVAFAAQGLPTMTDSLSLVRPVSSRVRVRPDEPCAGRAPPAASRTRSLAERGHYRYPERRNHEKRRAASTMPQSIPTARRSLSNLTPPMFRIVTAAEPLCKSHKAYFRSSRRSGQIADTITSVSHRPPVSPARSLASSPSATY